MDASPRVLSSEAPRYAGRHLFALIGLLLVSFWALDLGPLVSPAGAKNQPAALHYFSAPNLDYLRITWPKPRNNPSSQGTENMINFKINARLPA